MLDFTGGATTLLERGLRCDESAGAQSARQRYVGPFVLEKWYADIFDGACVRVAYRARLRLGPLTIGYTGGIGMTGRSSRRFMIGDAPLPQGGPSTVIWPADRLEPALSWSGTCSREHRLWQRGSRVVDWNPIVLNGTVSGEGVPPGSRGYVERLVINFGPWRLRLRRLKWGRFCGDRHSLVWIEWEGSQALKLGLLDGIDHPMRRVSATHVSGEGVLLRIGTPQVLIQETIADGALRGVHPGTRSGGVRFLDGVETKWFAFGELQLPGGELDEGHAVFEEVTWH